MQKIEEETKNMKKDRNDFTDERNKEIQEIIEDIKENGNQIFSKLKIIGSGTNGIVFQGIFRNNPEEIAIKFQVIDDPTKKEKELKALKIMNELDNLSFDILGVKYIGTFDIIDVENSIEYNLIIEGKADSDLKKKIKQKISDNLPFSNDEKKQLFENLMTNLYLLHINGIAHYDIKPGNVLYYEKYNKYLLRDFGECEQFDGDFDLHAQKSSYLAGTEKYMSPILREKLKDQRKNKDHSDTFHNPFKSDIYSLGLVFLEVSLAGTGKKIRFQSLDQIKGEIFFTSDDKHLELEEGNLIRYSRNKTLFEYMLTQDENSRLDVLELALLYDLPLFLWPFSIPPKLFNISSYDLGGAAKIKYLNGFSYEGGILNGKRNGMNCIIKTPKNEIYYDGTWEEDLPNGFGTIKFNENFKYEGEIFYGKLHGNGKIYFNNQEQIQYGNNWIRNKPREKLIPQIIDFKENCFYCLDPLFGYYENSYRGPSKIFVLNDNFMGTFNKISEYLLGKDDEKVN